MDRLHGVSRTVTVVVLAAAVLVAAGAGMAFVLTGDDGGDGPPEAELRVDVTALFTLHQQNWVGLSCNPFVVLLTDCPAVLNRASVAVVWTYQTL